MKHCFIRRSVSIQDAEEKYTRLIAMSLKTLPILAKFCDSQNIAKIIDNCKFWNYGSSENSLVQIQ